MMYWLFWVIRNFVYTVDRVADPILSPMVTALNKVTGASSSVMIPWIFGVALAMDLLGDALDHKLNPFQLVMAIFSHGYWGWHCHSVARDIENWKGDALPNVEGVILVFVMRAVLFALLVAWLVTLPFNYTAGNMIDWTSHLLFVVGLTAAVDIKGGRKSVVREAIDKVKDMARSLIPTPAPAPAMVGS